MYNSFRPGKRWLDNKGKPIHAHGFSVFYNEKDRLYYWLGENKERSTGRTQSGIGACASIPPKICITGRTVA